MSRISRLSAAAVAFTWLVAACPAPAQQGPVLTGQVYSADGGGIADLRAFLAGAEGDTALIGVAGEFQLSLPPRGGAVEVIVDATDPARRTYHPVVAVLDSAEIADGLRIVLVPLRWTIPTGTYAGRTVPISVRRAYAPACRDCPSFFRQGFPRAPKVRLVNPESWPAAAFPIRIAFDRGRSRSPITSRDSAAFWATVEAMERDFGERLFRPVPYSSTYPEEGEDVDDVILVSVEPSIPGIGYGSSVSQNGDIFYGAVRFRARALLHGGEGQRLVTHELMHALGIGHTCGWASVMSHLPVCGSARVATLSAEDVAYTQLLMRVRELQKAYGATRGIEAALEGERVLGVDP